MPPFVTVKTCFFGIIHCSLLYKQLAASKNVTAASLVLKQKNKKKIFFSLRLAISWIKYKKKRIGLYKLWIITLKWRGWGADSEVPLIQGLGWNKCEDLISFLRRDSSRVVLVKSKGVFR